MTLKRYLKDHPLYFFHKMSEEHQDMLSACSSPADYKEGEHIFHAKEEADHFYLIQVGEVAIRVSDHPKGPIVIQTVSTGEVLGFSWLMEPYQYRFDAVALEPTRLLAFDAAKLRKSMQQDHDFGYELMRRFLHVMSQRLHASRLQILDSYGEFSLRSPATE